ncbi:DUF397 domain-containing protein [Streptomyces sp. NPDC017943]|uniref:DUF397 domain-containing protein n=1 Tax=Streptomyces sp. NPDC017943 TaxID=3365019 RepID=UPI0037A4C7C5
MGSSRNVTEPRWRKSSYSGNTGGDCVEVAELGSVVAVRDSKDPGVGMLRLSPEAYAAFVGHVAVE